MLSSPIQARVQQPLHCEQGEHHPEHLFLHCTKLMRGEFVELFHFGDNQRATKVQHLYNTQGKTKGSTSLQYTREDKSPASLHKGRKGPASLQYTREDKRSISTIHKRSSISTQKEDKKVQHLYNTQGKTKRSKTKASLQYTREDKDKRSSISTIHKGRQKVQHLYNTQGKTKGPASHNLSTIHKGRQKVQHLYNTREDKRSSISTIHKGRQKVQHLYNTQGKTKGPASLQYTRKTKGILQYTRKVHLYNTQGRQKVQHLYNTKGPASLQYTREDKKEDKREDKGPAYSTQGHPASLQYTREDKRSSISTIHKGSRQKVQHLYNTQGKTKGSSISTIHKKIYHLSVH
ncbi:hypothetical protein CEXT_766521 [Caerostris extrusa]|uniref:Uncharacterized protein n=1 Tax=Caerostris extrusa TaxID=172846 RepID=A0AAV4S4C6_CAEEX|nr:hypothetical protein CEXT_766521 [Caerostris extrusa]